MEQCSFTFSVWIWIFLHFAALDLQTGLCVGLVANNMSPVSPQAIYMFHALAIVCDVYFVPSLEKVSEVWTEDSPMSGFVETDYLKLSL